MNMDASYDRALKYAKGDAAHQMLKLLHTEDLQGHLHPRADHNKRAVVADAVEEADAEKNPYWQSGDRKAEAHLLREGFPVHVDEEGRIYPDYPAWTWPGGYPLVYRDEKAGDDLCPDCVNREAKDAAEAAALGHEHRDAELEKRIKSYVPYEHHEGPPISCANCGTGIESSYGDFDAEHEGE